MQSATLNSNKKYAKISFRIRRSLELRGGFNIGNQSGEKVSNGTGELLVEGIKQS